MSDDTPAPEARSLSRRRLLAAVGAGAPFATAGCLARAPRDGGATATPTQAPGGGTTPAGTTATRTRVRVEDERLRTLDTKCLSGGGGLTVGVGSGDDGGEHLHVSGLMQAGNPCHRAVYRGADVSETVEGEAVTRSSVHLRFDVEADPASEACVECLGAVEFAFDATLVGEPDAVEVSVPGTTATWERS